MSFTTPYSFSDGAFMEFPYMEERAHLALAEAFTGRGATRFIRFKSLEGHFNLWHHILINSYRSASPVS